MTKRKAVGFFVIRHSSFVIFLRRIQARGRLLQACVICAAELT